MATGEILGRPYTSLHERMGPPTHSLPGRPTSPISSVPRAHLSPDAFQRPGKGTCVTTVLTCRPFPLCAWPQLPLGAPAHWLRGSEKPGLRAGICTGTKCGCGDCHPHPILLPTTNPRCPEQRLNTKLLLENWESPPGQEGFGQNRAPFKEDYM